MINKPVVLGVLGIVLAAPFVAAQVPKPNQPQTPSQTSTTVQPTTTLTGCLYREDQVPGRKPNIAERAGVLEDYILADATVADAKQQPRPSGAPAAGTSGTLPTTGTMYKVENIPDERLKALVGKRVEVAGRIDPEGRGVLGVGGGVKPDRGLGPDAISLPEFEASSIREVAGTCPAAPPLPK